MVCCNKARSRAGAVSLTLDVTGVCWSPGSVLSACRSFSIPAQPPSTTTAAFCSPRWGGRSGFGWQPRGGRRSTIKELSWNTWLRQSVLIDEEIMWCSHYEHVSTDTWQSRHYRLISHASASLTVVSQSLWWQAELKWRFVAVGLLLTCWQPKSFFTNTLHDQITTTFIAQLQILHRQF